MSKNLLKIAATSAVASLGVAVAPSVLLPQAVAAPSQAQQTYKCAITVDENPTDPYYMDLTVNVTLNLPDQVQAGSDMNVDGSFQVQVPGELGALFGAYFPSAQVVSDGLTVPVNVGGQDQLISASRVDSGQIDTRKPPLILGGDFSLDPIAVPADAAGEVNFNMPRNDSVPAISEDGMSAFTATLIAQGGIVPGYDKGTDRVSCKSPSGESAAIGSVPIAAGENAGDTAGDTGGAAPAPAEAPAGGSNAPQGQAGATGNAPAAAGAPAGGGSNPGNRIQSAQSADAATKPKAGAAQDPQANKDGQVPPANGADAAAPSADNDALAEQLRLMSMNQAAESSQGGSYVSKEVIGWGTLGVVVTAILFTILMNSRTRRLERFKDEYQ